MKAKKIWFDKERIYLETDEGKTGNLLLKDFPLLYNATEEQRNNYSLSPFGIHWEELDEDLSYEGFFLQEEKIENNPVSFALKKFPEINVNQFARRIGINKSLLAKYVCGNKKPSKERTKQIEAELHRLGEELLSVKLD
jgi:transcriptional regulator with XRE-family HTH domain